MIDMQAMNEQIAQSSIFIEDIQGELAKVLVGQKYMINGLLIGLLTQGAYSLRRSTWLSQNVNYIIIIKSHTCGFSANPVYSRFATS